MKITSVIKIHFLTFMAILLCVFIPYISTRAYLPQVPYTLYYYLIVLAVIKYILFEDKKYRLALRPKLEKYIQQEIKRQPSKQEVITRTESMLFVRDMLILFFAFIGIFVNIIL